MLMIKLSKVGKINKKVFRLIISEKARDPFGKILENLGSYNPHTKDLQAKTDRIKYWLEKGAQMTDTVNNLLIGKNIITGEKVTASKPGKKSQKRLDQMKTKQEKKNSDSAKEESPIESSLEEEPTEKTAETEIKAEIPANEQGEGEDVANIKEEAKE
ncbi:MAG TPA: 30S ribosomal protein S16 [Patescibacteria group bacterium]|nr:30S ribosomal protein S16 [Patescibacteria group bacterium]